MKAINEKHYMSRLCRRKNSAAVLMLCGFLICLAGPLLACVEGEPCDDSDGCNEGLECCAGICITECDSDCEVCDEVSGTCEEVEVVSVSYLGDAEVWKGTEVTWEVETDPAGNYDMVSVSGGEYDSATGEVSSDCSASSASNTTKYMDVTATICESSVDATDGPVIYHLASANVDPETICQGDTSQLVTVIDPSGGGLIPTFGGSQISASGLVDTDSPTLLSPGNYTYSAEGDVTITSVLDILTGVIDEWTDIDTPDPTYPAGVNDSYDINQTYSTPDWSPGDPIPAIWVMWHIEKTGTVKSYEDTVVTGWKLESACNTDAEYTFEFEYGWGTELGVETPWHIFGIHIYTGMRWTYSYSYTLPAVAHRRYRVRLHIPRWKVVDHRGTHMSQYKNCHNDPYTGPECDANWTTDSNPPEDVETYMKFGTGQSYEKDGACCDMEP